MPIQIEKDVLTIKEVQELLKEFNRTEEEFRHFMRGQTVTQAPNGETLYMSEDVERFLNNLPIVD